MIIFCNNNEARTWLNNLNITSELDKIAQQSNTPSSNLITDSIDTFISAADYKVAFIFENKYHSNYYIYTKVFNSSNQSFIISDHCWTIWNNLKNSVRKNLFTVGPIKTSDKNLLKNIFWNCWINHLIELYSSTEFLANLLDELNPFVEKKFPFDALLGEKRHNRDYVQNLIENNNFLNLETCAYRYTAYNNKFINKFDDSNWIQEPGVEFKENNYYFRGVNLGNLITNLIPVSVYNKSLFSIVSTAETARTNINYSIFCEKIAKPILAKRLFIVFSSADYLKHLRELGFQTFGTIIDESYDTIHDPLVRWNTAFEQVKLLSKQNQVDIIEKIKPIVTYNFNHLMNTNWNKQTKDEIVTIIKNDNT